MGLPTGWGMCSRTISFDYIPTALARGKDIIAVGLEHHDIKFLDAITGSWAGTLSGHTDWVRSLAFSPCGKLLVSGSDDKTIKLWDIQTGGVTKTFPDQSSSISSVSISSDLTTVASGSWDGTIHLWGIPTGTLLPVTLRHDGVTTVSFSPTDPQHIISASENGEVRQWNIDGQQIGSSHGLDVAFSPDGTRFISSAATIHDSKTGAEIFQLRTPDPSATFQHCRFSPDGKLVACATSNEVFVWDISGPASHFVGSFIAHTEDITSIAFSSFLITASQDQSVKFWQIGTSLAGPNLESGPLAPVPIRSVSLQAEHGIAISSDSGGVVRTWDLSTGLCKGSFKTPAKGRMDMQEIDGKLIVVWYDWRVGEPGEIHVWDAQKGEPLRTFGRFWSRVLDLKISGDGSKVFLLDDQSIRAWTLTGEVVGEAKLMEWQPYGLTVDGSRVWLLGSNPVGWDFGVLNSSPVELSNTFPNMPRFNIDGAGKDQKRSPWIEVKVAGRTVFYLPERFVEHSTISSSRWDGRYLVVGRPSGEVLILDFGHSFLE